MYCVVTNLLALFTLEHKPRFSSEKVCLILKVIHNI